MNRKQLRGQIAMAWSIAIGQIAIPPGLANSDWLPLGNQSTCYHYQQDQLTSTIPCKLSYTNKIGLQTIRIDWPDQTWSGVEKMTQCDFLPNVNFTVDGYCRFFVNGRRALRYHRSSTQINAGGNAIGEQGDITCYQIQETKNSVCIKL
jgi:hypothetical protein